MICFTDKISSVEFSMKKLYDYNFEEAGQQLDDWTYIGNL